MQRILELITFELICQFVASQPLRSALRTGPCQITRQNCQSGTLPMLGKIRMRPREQIKHLSMCYIQEMHGKNYFSKRGTQRNIIPLKIGGMISH